MNKMLKTSSKKYPYLTSLVSPSHAARHHVDAAQPELLRAERVAGDHVAQELPDPVKCSALYTVLFVLLYCTPCAQTQSRG